MKKQVITLPGHVYSVPKVVARKRRVTLAGHGYATPKASN